MGIGTAEREACLEFIQKMAYAKSEVEYNQIYHDFVSFAPKVVKDYFEKNWHGIKEEWVMGFKFSTGNFLNATNNRLEAINGKLKQVITRSTTMEVFIDEFFVILPCLRELRNYQTMYAYQKVPVIPHNISTPRGQYAALLTPYARSFMFQQIDIAESQVYEYTRVDGNGSGNAVTVISSEGKIEVSHFRCSCCYFST